MYSFTVQCTTIKLNILSDDEMYVRTCAQTIQNSNKDSDNNQKDKSVTNSNNNNREISGNNSDSVSKRKGMSKKQK